MCNFFLAQHVNSASESVIGPLQYNNPFGINLTPDNITLVLPAGTGYTLDPFLFDLIIFQNGSNISVLVKLNASSGSPGDFLTDFITNSVSSPNQTNISLPVAGHNTTTAVFKVPAGTNQTTYSGYIFATSQNDGRTDVTELNITVNNTNPVTSVTLVATPTGVSQGNNLTAYVNITKGTPNGTAPLIVRYCITLQSANADCNNNTAQESDNRTISTVLNYTRSIRVDRSAGDYFLKIAVEYPGDPSAKNASDAFTVIAPSAGGAGGGGGGGGGGQPVQIRAPILEISGPSVVEVMHGESESVTITVKNAGNASVENVVLIVFGLPRQWFTVFPTRPVNISAGEEQEYRLELTVPSNTTIEGSLDVLLTAQNNVSASMTMMLVTAKTERLLASLLIAEAEKLQEDTEEFIDILKAFGIDVSMPEDFLDTATVDLLDAKNNFDLGNYNESIILTKAVTERLDRALDTLNIIARDNYDRVVDELRGMFLEIRQSLSRDVRDSIENKFQRAAILFETGSYKESFRVLLDIKNIISPPLFGFFSPFFIALIVSLLVLSYVLYRRENRRYIRERLLNMRRHIIGTEHEWGELKKKWAPEQFTWEGLKKKWSRKKGGENSKQETKQE